MALTESAESEIEVVHPIRSAWQDVSQSFRQADNLPAQKHEIFLSFSGAQRNFTEQLCVELERNNLFPFYDERSTSLPKGESFPPLIFSAAAQCRVAVLILSHEYFTRSIWPMTELVEFVNAKTTTNPRLKLLPCYFQISRHDFNTSLRTKRWLPAWEEFANSDKRIDLERWNKGVAALCAEDGIEYSEYRSEVAYRKAIVDAIQFLIPPTLKFDESQIQGKDRLCKVMSKLFDESQQSQGTAQVVGIYGIGGSGKTTLCKALCNFYHFEFHGRVCHLEFGKKSLVHLQKKVLRELTEASEALLQQISDADQGQLLLIERLHKYKAFVALDNVSDTQELLDSARMLLRAGFHPQSKVLVTARTRNVLERVFGGRVAPTLIAIPKLTQEEAICLFLQHATYQKLAFESFSPECQDVIHRCVERCFQGHPLALKALGARLCKISDTDPLEWSEVLGDLDFKMTLDRVDPIFSILRASYDALPERHKLIFIDIALYAPQSVLLSVGTLCHWLGYLHQRKPHTIKEMLLGMRAKALIENWVSMDSTVTVHDLYKDIAELEVKEGAFKNSCIYERETSNALTKATVHPQLDLIRVKLLPGSSNLLSKDVMNSIWNVEVFSLQGCDGLRKLDVRSFRNLRVLSLQECANLDEVLCSEAQKTGQLKQVRTILQYVIPKKLQVLENNYASTLRFLTLERCKSLTRLPDLKGCVNLNDLTVSYCENLVKPPELTSCTKLRELKLVGCKHLEEPPNLSNCSELVELHMWEMEKLKKMPRLHRSTALKYVSLFGCRKLNKGHGLDQLTNLKDLGIIDTSIKYANLVKMLNPLKKLEKIRCEVSQATGNLGDTIDLREVRLTTTELKKKLNLGESCFLKRLTIFPNELYDVGDLKTFSKMETIYISSNESYKARTLCGLDTMPQLEKLHVWECTGLTYVSDLTSLNGLKMVNSYNCNSVEGLVLLPEQKMKE